jgi:hypothetical protein
LKFGPGPKTEFNWDRHFPANSIGTDTFLGTAIPSPQRLDAAVTDGTSRLSPSNVGEDLARVNRFLRQVLVELPVLMDYDASISKDWMIYVYPSSYLVDRQGNNVTHTWGHWNGIQRKSSGSIATC